MPTPGAHVFDTIRQALLDAQERAVAARDEMQRLEQEVETLVNQRSEAVLELARLVLPELTRTAVEAGFADVRHDLLTIVERKDRRAREVNDRLSRLLQEAAALRAKRDAAQAAHLAAVQKLADMQTTLTRALEQDVAFQELSRRALEAEAELKRDEERVAEIATEAQHKLPAYERSRLFQYLIDQRFGTPQYRGRGVIRRLDRWVAGLVEYETASRSYRFLQTTPGLMDAETARRKAEFHGLMRQVEVLEQTAAERLELSRWMREVDDAARALDRAAAQLADAERRAAAVQEELAALDREQGRFYDEALNRLKTYLSTAETGLLERRAAATSDARDDEVTVRIRVLTDEIEALQPRLRRQEEQCAAATRVSDGLSHLARRFEQANFHEMRSFFRDGYNISRSLELFRSGVLARDAFWDEIKQHQERVPTEFEKRASEKISQAMNGPLGGALAEAMLSVAGAAVGQSVGRSMSRRRALGGEPSAAEGGARWVRINPPKGSSAE